MNRISIIFMVFFLTICSSRYDQTFIERNNVLTSEKCSDNDRETQVGGRKRGQKSRRFARDRSISAQGRADLSRVQRTIFKNEKLRGPGMKRTNKSKRRRNNREIGRKKRGNSSRGRKRDRTFMREQLIRFSATNSITCITSA